MFAELATQEFQHRLQANPYPGRGIVLGKTTTGDYLQIYWIMGRSENSRNRIFTQSPGCLQTQAADPRKVKDPSLIIYNAMRETPQHYLVTNGSQTDAIYEGLTAGKSFEESLLPQRHEPDAPNFTPRISGCWDLSGTPKAILSIIKRSPFSEQESEHHFFYYTALIPGYGYGITTYRADGDPLPTFAGSPFLLPLVGTAEEIAATFWAALNEANKIALAVKRIEAQTRQVQLVVVNQYQAVSG